MILLNEGLVEQAGSPDDIYRSPQTPFAATFVGRSIEVTDYSLFKGFGEEENKEIHGAAKIRHGIAG